MDVPSASTSTCTWVSLTGAVYEVVDPEAVYGICLLATTLPTVVLMKHVMKRVIVSDTKV